MKVDGTWSRSQLVLALANQEGGAQVDPDLNEKHESLAKLKGWAGLRFLARPPARSLAIQLLQQFVRSRPRFGKRFGATPGYSPSRTSSHRH